MRKNAYIYVIAGAMSIASCNSLDKIVKSNDINMKLTKANEYYDKGKWYRAKEIYASLLQPLKGTRNFEELQYRYAMTYLKMGDNMSASYQLKNYLDLYPNSERDDEVSFQYAKCLYDMSYKYTLDQTSTYKAISALQTFISTHPKSQYLTLGNKYLDESEAKIEQKNAAACKLYYDLGQYKAAVASYNYLLQQYPDSKSADEYQWMLMKSAYDYAEASYTEKQEERYSTVIDYFKPFDEYYKNSIYYAQSLKLKGEAEQNIKEVRILTDKIKAEQAKFEKEQELKKEKKESNEQQ